jgi:hypothetical protein
MFLRDKDWVQVVKTIHFPSSLFLLWGLAREKCEHASQANQRIDRGFRAISRRPSPLHKTGLRGGRQGDPKSRLLRALAELFQERTLGLVRESPTEKRISPFLAFLGDAEPKKLVIGRRYCGSAKLGDSNSLKSADPRDQTPRSPADETWR